MRSGRMRLKTLATGEPGTPGNFALMLSHTPDGYDSPRHRHNFDQVRVQLHGDADFARNGVMRPGSIAYFPEGVHYGPQSIAGESATLVLQFGGASGSGYISEARFQQAVDELRRHGTFENGVFRRHEGESGRKNQDGKSGMQHERPRFFAVYIGETVSSDILNTMSGARDSLCFFISNTNFLNKYRIRKNFGGREKPCDFGGP